uniref:Uncharacterized protein n=1 Tax=Arundo donax TaxID=35708 RepID=A0A0A9A8U6_ARUDO
MNLLYPKIKITQYLAAYSCSI